MPQTILEASHHDSSITNGALMGREKKREEREWGGKVEGLDSLLEARRGHQRATEAFEALPSFIERMEREREIERGRNRRQGSGLGCQQWPSKGYIGGWGGRSHPLGASIALRRPSLAFLTTSPISLSLPFYLPGSPSPIFHCVGSRHAKLYRRQLAQGPISACRTLPITE